MQPPLPKAGAQKISTKKLISENTGETGHGADEGAVSRFHFNYSVVTISSREHFFYSCQRPNTTWGVVFQDPHHIVDFE